MRDHVLKFIRGRSLCAAGDRIAVAVSGGADSVALLRVLVELQKELGIVLSVAHFHHGIRGTEADADQEFVTGLAEPFGLEIHLGSGDAPAYAAETKVSLETAARELRHRWFASLLAARTADKIATAHTQDDQAETVLMRVLRGTGSRGLAGIAPRHAEKSLIRPLLETSRSEVEQYLTNLKQRWREDSSNKDLAHTRNRVRHQLLPLLEREFNPAIRRTLADLAEVAQGEAEYWEKELAEIMPRLVREGEPSRSGRSSGGQGSGILSLDIAAFRTLPVALHRVLLQKLAGKMGATLEFRHVQELTHLVKAKSANKRLLLPTGLVATRTFRELQFSHGFTQEESTGYACSLKIPGEVAIFILGSTIRARLINREKQGGSEYNSALLLDRALLERELIVRNWHAGDRYFPAHTQSPKKVKELLQPARLGRPISPLERRSWPVVVSAGQIVWMRGFPVPESFAPRGGDAVLIEEIQTNSGAEQ